jgi:hypothetical protein
LISTVFSELQGHEDDRMQRRITRRLGTGSEPRLPSVISQPDARDVRCCQACERR